MSSNYKVLGEDSEFLKPDLDDRKYRYIQLPNNLKALLISDAEADKAAAALDVNIGSFQDPEHLPGLAHFCEHLLFMGNKKYPDENDYSSFLSKHGGSSNAYTGSQNTNYYFHLNHENLYAALDRFSGFFSCPLFNQSSTDKEINAVDSENKKNLQNDIWRMYQLDKSLTNWEHPYHKFSTGNLKTLGELPKLKGIDIRSELLDFHKNNYSANLIKLCVLGREDLDTLSDWVYELFKDVPNLNKEVPYYPAQLYTKSQLKKLIYCKPVKDLKKIEFTFPAPDMDPHWESKPNHYLSHLIGHEGNGSLLAFLKEKGWAVELSAGSHTISKDNAVFGIEMDLTDDGMSNVDEIIVATFQYLEMLKITLPEEWIHNELRDTSASSFKFKQKGSPSSTVSNMARLLEKEYIPVADILSTSLIRNYDPSTITKYIKSLNWENSRIMLTGQKLPVDSKEQWYGTEYKVLEYPESLVKRLPNVGLNSKFHLPRPNEFICTKFDVKKLDDAKPLDEPFLLKDDHYSKLWYKKDDRFWVPKCHIYVSMKLPQTFSTVVNSMLTSVYVDMIKDSLVDLQYDASCADLRISLGKTNQGIDIQVSGYNEKLTILLTRFLEGIRSFQPRESRFNVVKDRILQKLSNQQYDVPYNQISNEFNSLVNERSWTTKAKLDVTKDLTFEHLKGFVPTIFEQLYHESLVLGNFSVEMAYEINQLVDMLVLDRIPNLQVKNNKLRSYILPDDSTFRYESQLEDKENVNSCIQYLIQFGPYTEELAAKASLIAQLIHEPCFDTLRTKEQLGYVVFSSAANTHGTTNLRVLVQSERSSPYLESRIVKFLTAFGNSLEEMSEEAFEKHKSGLIKNLLQKLTNLRQEYDRFTTAIYLGDYNFCSNQRRADIISKMSKTDMVEFYQNFVLSPHSSRLVIHLKSQIEKNSPEDIVEGFPTGTLISDIDEFKSNLFLAPVRQAVKQYEPTNPML
ncbi:unnamed protein product [Kluyveromyces dobzhanskii CBS 2104]|uniref:WGS project CCBQ000000000 data, contig 00106 n=1 Tax=Kluyveromyces dobzhanskii CBS 2104 TaxID=1427455 RepID=A0A0A8L810_9SACH|nr:unnamed protein product [Kluyveromyces dobzhanskii CBS 2104]